MWLQVLLAFGMALYLALPEEPTWFMAVPVAGPVTRGRCAGHGSGYCPAGGPGDSPEILIDGRGRAMAARLPDGKVLVATPYPA